MRGAAGKSIDVEIRLNHACATQATEKAMDRVYTIAKVAREYAKENSPVKTGHNRSSITLDKDANGFYLYTMSGYGLPLETRRRKATSGEWTGMSPYIEPAIRRAFDEAVQRGK